MENPIKMDDLGVPLFLETPIYWDFCTVWVDSVFPSVLQLQICQMQLMGQIRLRYEVRGQKNGFKISDREKLEKFTILGMNIAPLSCGICRNI